MTTRERIDWVMKQPMVDMRYMFAMREHFCKLGLTAIIKSGRDPEQMAPIEEIGRLYERYGNDWEKYYNEQ